MSIQRIKSGVIADNAVTSEKFASSLTLPANVAVTNGIAFPATQSASANANTLDDYEEGTWTPTLVTTGTGFTSISYSGFTSGRYTKIGQVVHIQCVVSTDSITVGSASGDVQIGGLPFAAVAASAGLNGRSAFSVGQAGSFAVNHPSGAFVNSSASAIFLGYRSTANGGLLNLAPSDLGTGITNNFILLSGTYISS